jgi:hypothetical protein
MPGRQLQLDTGEYRDNDKTRKQGEVFLSATSLRFGQAIAIRVAMLNGALE